MNVGYHIPANSESPLNNGCVSLTAYLNEEEKETRLNHFFKDRNKFELESYILLVTKQYLDNS